MLEQSHACLWRQRCWAARQFVMDNLDVGSKAFPGRYAGAGATSWANGVWRLPEDSGQPSRCGRCLSNDVSRSDRNAKSIEPREKVDEARR